MKKITVEEAIKVYGFNPGEVGNRPRGWEVEDDGRLAICARDGGYNEPDMTAGKYPNYDGTETDDGDITYRYYYYKPLATPNSRSTKDGE